MRTMNWFAWRTAAMGLMLCLIVPSPADEATPFLHAPDPSWDATLAKAIHAATEEVAPSIVRIETTGGLEAVNKKIRGTGPTTGLVVHADGWIVSSSYNLAHRPAGILVVTADGVRRPARIVASDFPRHLVLLKIEATNLPVPMPAASLKVGQTALALGKTWTNDRPSVSLGIVSALDRIWGKAVQTDAKVSPVNYGGPLIDLTGNVIGVLAPLSPTDSSDAAGLEWYDAGIGFAIPWSDVLASFPKWKNGDRRAGLTGFVLASTDPLAAPLVLTGTSFRSPASLVGLEAGDRLLSVNGQTVNRVGSLRHALGRAYAGDTISVTARRGDKQVERSLLLVAELPQYRRPYLGMKVAEVSAGDPGVRVISVADGSPADQAGVKDGDMVTALANVPVKDAADLRRRLLAGYIAGESVLITVRPAMTQEPISQDRKLVAEAFPSTFSTGPAAADTTVMPNKQPDDRSWVSFETSEKERGLIRKADSLPMRSGGLLMVLGGDGRTSRDQLAAYWKEMADRIGLSIALVEPTGPKGWMPEDLPRLGRLLDAARSQIKPHPEQVFVQAAGPGVPIALAFVQGRRRTVRGLITVGTVNPAALGRTDPATRLSWAMFLPAADVQRIQANPGDPMKKSLESRGIDVLVRDFGGRTASPTLLLPKERLEELVSWMERLTWL